VRLSVEVNNIISASRCSDVHMPRLRPYMWFCWWDIIVHNLSTDLPLGLLIFLFLLFVLCVLGPDAF
jgi:hypothetical protein